MLYGINLYNAVCQLYLNKTNEKINNQTETKPYHEGKQRGFPPFAGRAMEAHNSLIIFLNCQGKAHQSSTWLARLLAAQPNQTKPSGS